MREHKKDLKRTKKYCLYRHTSPSGKIYIGITSTSIIARWGKNGQRYKDNTYFSNAIKKYGWDKFKHEVLFDNLSEERAKKLEIDLIRHYKNLNICYNISAGGDGNSHPASEETKRKLSMSLKGHKSYERTEEWRKQVSLRMKANPIFTNEHREKARFKSAETLSKKVVQKTLDGDVLNIYKSAREASRITGFDHSFISKCCRGKTVKDKKGYGFLWEYIIKKDF